MSDIETLAALIRDSRGVQHKGDIAEVVAALGIGGSDSIPVGDDTAAIPDGDGHLLFAIEGFVDDFVAADPWFAGYCGVMVNVSDILAMGGRPIAVVDAIWSKDSANAASVLAGMRAAAARYGVPIVGGHSNLRAASAQLAVAILGRAKRPVTSFAAQPGDVLLVATDLGGNFRGAFPWWDASTASDPIHLRRTMEILPELAEMGLLTGVKDISMAGVVGTAMMLAEASAIGCIIDLDRLPIPPGIAMQRWLTAFPSFGFVMTAPASNAPAIIAAFARENVACAIVGTADDSHTVLIQRGDTTATVWDFAHPLTGCTRANALIPEKQHA